jgi:hypothetical protein
MFQVERPPVFPIPAGRVTRRFLRFFMALFCDGNRREIQPRRAKLGGMWRKTLLGGGILLVAVVPTLADQVYRSVDADGHVVYSDRASSPKAQKTTVNVIQADPAEAARAQKQTGLLNAQDAQRKQDREIDERNKAKQENEKQVRCQNARNRYNSIKDANILYKLDAQGNRQFYSDAEADARREQARQAMIAACGP